MSLIKQLIRNKDKAMDKAKNKGTKKFKDSKKWQVNAKSLENKTCVFQTKYIYQENHSIVPSNNHLYKICFLCY